MPTIETDAQRFNWLVESFAEKVPGVIDAVAVSADGLLIAMSDGIGRAGGDQLAAIASGLTSLTAGASRCFGGGAVRQLVVELEAGYMFFMTISGGSALAVLATHDADVGQIGYEMTMLARRVGTVLTPSLVAELQRTLPRG